MQGVFHALFLLMYPPLSMAGGLVINEVSPRGSPEWVEIMNVGSGEIDLSLFIIRDGNSSETDDIKMSGTIAGNSYVVFENDKWLNDTGDTVKLIEISNGNILDEVTYKKIDEEYSWGRFPDGTGGFELNYKTANGNNRKLVVDATPTPTQTSTPTSSPSSTPTPTPTVEKTSTPTPTRAVQSTITSTPVVTSAVTKSESKTQASEKSKTVGEDGKVLAASTTNNASWAAEFNEKIGSESGDEESNLIWNDKDKEKEDENKNEGEVRSGSSNKILMIAVLVGVLLLLGSLIWFVRIYRRTDDKI